jgi:hypothetical protein
LGPPSQPPSLPAHFWVGGFCFVVTGPSDDSREIHSSLALPHNLNFSQK